MFIDMFLAARGIENIKLYRPVSGPLPRSLTPGLRLNISGKKVLYHSCTFLLPIFSLFLLRRQRLMWLHQGLSQNRSSRKVTKTWLLLVLHFYFQHRRHTRRHNFCLPERTCGPTNAPYRMSCTHSVYFILRTLVGFIYFPVKSPPSRRLISLYPDIAYHQVQWAAFNYFIFSTLCACRPHSISISKAARGKPPVNKKPQKVLGIFCSFPHWTREKCADFSKF